MLAVINSAFAKPSSPKYQSNQNVRSFWTLLSCVESAEDKNSVVSCDKEGFEGPELEYIDWRIEMRFAWIDSMKGVSTKEYQGLMSKMQSVQTLPHVYQPEIKIFQEINTGLPLPQAIEAAEALDENFRL